MALDRDKAAALAPAPAPAPAPALAPDPPSSDPAALAGADDEKAPRPARDYFTLGMPLIAAVDDARQYPRSIKHPLTCLVAACGLATPLGSNIFLPVLAPAGRELDTTPTVMNLSIAFYCLAVAVTPMWWATLSEQTGSRRTYVLSFFCFIVFNVIAAVSVSPAMFIAMRLLAGGASAPVQALGAATVADLWHLEERASAMGIFLLGAMCGNVLGPILGGVLGSRWGWRSTQWLMAIYGAVIWLAILLFLPETSRARRRTAGPGSSPGSSPDSPPDSPAKPGRAAAAAARLAGLASALARPLKLIPLLRFPPILITVCYTSINFAAYYYLMIAIQAVFSSPPYSYSVLIVGVLYLPNAVGNVLAATLGGRWTDRVMRRKAIAASRLDAKGRPKPKPQDALGLNIWIAGLLFPAATIVSGWSSDKHLMVAVPLVANFFFALGNMMVQNVTTVTLTEFVPGRAAAGVALANLVRNTLGAIVCVITQPLLDAIGVGWLSTIVGIFCAFCAVSIWLLQRNGERWAKDMAQKLPQVP